jgi:hypothetical protein
MIWFDLKELELKLRNGDLSNKDIFNYLLAGLLMESIFSYMKRDDYTSKWLVAIEIIIVIITTVVGMKRTFDINSTSDNKDYFKRYLSLSFVIGIRLVVFVFIAAIPIGIISYFVDKNIGVNQNMKDIFNLVIIAATGIFYYFMLINSFKRVSRLNDSN